MLLGGGSPVEFAPALCAPKSALSENEETLALASLHDALASSGVSAQMRRVSGPRGVASRQDVLVAAFMDAAPEGEDLEARIARCKAKRAKKGGKGRGGFWEQEELKSSVEGRTRNEINRRTGERNGRYT